MFTLTQWLTLAAVIIIPQIVLWVVGKAACSLVDRDIRRYRQTGSHLENM